MKRLNLTGEWRLRGEFLDVGSDRWPQVLAREEGTFSVLRDMQKPRRMPSRTGSLVAKVPGDVMEALIGAGIVGEPMEKTNARDVMWVGELGWWLWRTFTVDDELLDSEQIRLTIGTLDYAADILVNGVPVGHHENAFRPFVADVKSALKRGENQLIVRLSTGYEKHFPNDSLTFYCNSQFGQRVYLRKPQFTHGWDWCKPVPTCGIGGEVSLEGVSGARISAFRMDTLSVTGESARLRFHFELENLRPHTADDAELRVSVRLGGKEVLSFSESIYAAGGLNFVDRELELPDPMLWWPNGYGAQPLYEVSASVVCRGYESHMAPKKVGVRTIALDMGKYEDGTRRFYFVVNGVRVFCKGGNWVPADSLYLRVPEEKYRALVSEAVACNATMLRIWGGGLYEPDCFYDACSEKGILVMQDFMYACAFYPDHLDWFMHEAALEAEYQVKRLASQACLCVWTGNNEIHESYTDWFKGEMAPERLQGEKIFNHLLPQVVRNHSPLTHYMPSSPFYGDKANDMLAGDCHVWSWMRKPNETGFEFMYELEAFDRMAAKVRFSSEYGFYGPLVPSSVARLHGGEPTTYQGDIWTYHGEHPGKRRIIDEALARHVADPAHLDGDRYLLMCGVLQGTLYEEMTLALRRREHCSGQLIWMYNDCWPETGWTVIDYYLSRKHSFYFLKRAFAQRKLIARVEGNQLHICALNESPDAVSLNLEIGSLALDGQLCPAQVMSVDIEAFGRWELTLDAPEGGLSYVRSDHRDFEPVTSLRGYYRDHAFADAKIEVVRMKRSGGATEVTLRSDKFVPVAHVALADDTTKLSDNFFTMLPNVEKTILIEAGADQVNVQAVRFERAAH